jgi:hypothetical protein
MRRTASEMLNDLEMRVAHLEKTSTNNYYPKPIAQLTFIDESGKVVDTSLLKGREITDAIETYNLTEVTVEIMKKSPHIFCRQPYSDSLESVELMASQEQFAVCMLRELSNSKLNISN